jgi:hypothetical protein
LRAPEEGLPADFGFGVELGHVKQFLFRARIGVLRKIECQLLAESRIVPGLVLERFQRHKTFVPTLNAEPERGD